MIRFNPSLRNSFYKTVAWLISDDPKNKYAKNQTTSNIRAVEVKNGIGETGVHLRFHTGNEYDCMYGSQRAELHNWRHSSDGKFSSTGYPEDGGRSRYGRCIGRDGRGWGRGGRGRGIGRGRGNFESQVAAIISKTAKNEANKLTNALETVADAASAVNGSFPGIPPPVISAAPNPVVFASDVRK